MKQEKKQTGEYTPDETADELGWTLMNYWIIVIDPFCSYFSSAFI
jgi:hypothetical protein